jgi:hypothetical protein
LLLAMAELGYRIGLRLHLAQDEPRTKQIGAAQAAVLRLLLFTVVITPVADLERPHHGLIGLNQQSLRASSKD